jgi:hypothetical protein
MVTSISIALTESIAQPRVAQEAILEPKVIEVTRYRPPELVKGYIEITQPKIFQLQRQCAGKLIV